MASNKVIVVGAGLAGSEAAWQLAQRGIKVELLEMRPQRLTPAHKTGLCAELVCSNSFKSRSTENAHGLLKAEMAHFQSLILQAAETAALPAGQALAVDREIFSEAISQKIRQHPLIELRQEEVQDWHPLTQRADYVLIATGPLTSDPLAESLQSLVGCDTLAFYDAIAPVVMADSIDMQIAYKASRYNKGEADYINCPLDKSQYEAFIEAIGQAEKVQSHQFENIRPFEGCLPIEVMVERGADTLRFGPMKPVGLIDPNTDRQPHAVVQLRQENAAASLYNLVGFQTKMTWTAQRQVLRLIPGLENAEFVRFGSIHRNTFINSPSLLNWRLQLQLNPALFFAGQITGVEGYMESTAMGIYSALQIAALMQGKSAEPWPTTTMMGALVRYITQTNPASFQPMNANFGLLDPPVGKLPKKERKKVMSELALQAMATLAQKSQNQADFQ